MRIKSITEVPDLVMEGHEGTGEMRPVNADEKYLHRSNIGDRWVLSTWHATDPSTSHYIIVRKVKPERLQPKDGQKYQHLEVHRTTWEGSMLNIRHLQMGNCFLSINIQTAIDAIAEDIENEQSKS